MNGLIIKEPYATKIVTGKKKLEYRKTPIPKKKIGETVYILTPKKDGCKIVGQATFYPSNQGETTWRVIDPIKIDEDITYKPKSGCVIWINNVEEIIKDD